jgi:hypothetical protein
VSVTALVFLTGVAFSVHPERKVCYTEDIFLQKISSLKTEGPAKAPFFFCFLCYSDCIPDNGMGPLTNPDRRLTWVQQLFLVQ